jgi:hypothetical protein
MIGALGLTMRLLAFQGSQPKLVALTIVNPDNSDPIHNWFTACGFGADGSTLVAYVYDSNGQYFYGTQQNVSIQNIDWKFLFDARPSQGQGWVLHVETAGATEVHELDYELFDDPSSTEPTENCPDDRIAEVKQVEQRLLPVRGPKSLTVTWTMNELRATGRVGPRGKEVIGYIYDHTMPDSTKIWWARRGDSTQPTENTWGIQFDRAQMPDEWRGRRRKLHVQTLGGRDRNEIDVQLPD